VERETLYRRFLDTGSDDDWSLLVAALAPLFARIVYRLCLQSAAAGTDIADDALQEALLKLHSQRQRLRERLLQLDPASVEPYLKVLAANSTRDFLRLRRGVRQAEPPEEKISFEGFLDSLGVTTKPKAPESLLYLEIDQALGDDRRGRTVFWLYYRWGFKAREIASIPALSLSVKGVESLLHRTAERVRRRLDKAGASSPVARRPGHV